MRHLNVTSLFAAAALFAAGFEPLAHAQSASSPLNLWTQSAALSAPRAQACAAVLSDGRLLVMGGLGQSGAVATVDVYGADGSFTPGAPMTQPRANAGCVTMSDGRILVAGGNSGAGTLKTAEIFDPAANQWTPTGDLNAAREGHTMAITGWGVWVAGGTNNGTINGALELFNPVTGQFLTVGSLNTPRAEFAMAPQGRNLVIAGGTDGTNTLSSVELYDSALGTVTVAGSMSQARKDFGAAALLDGTVLMTGGLDANGVALSTTEFFDPVKGTSVAGPALQAARSSHTAYAMPDNGSVLIYGGAGTSGVLSTAEIYTPWNGTIAQAAPLNNARQYEAKATLRPGHYFVAGGRNDSGLVAGSELYQFSTIATDKPDYAPGTAVKISGGGWAPGEQVLVTITAYPVDQHHIEFTGAALADGAGNINVPGFAVDKSHLGKKFLLSAVGSQSQAETTFNDQNVPTISYSFSPALATVTPNATLTVTVTITGSAGTPTGTITPTDNSTVIASATGTGGTTCTTGASNQCTLIGGVANLSFVVTQGAHAFSVFYSGDTNYDSENPGNTSPITNFNVQSPTFTSLSGPASVNYGSQTPYIATVCTSSNGTSCSGTAGDLSGSVQFSVDGSVQATVPVSSQNVAAGTASASFVPSPPLTVAGSPHSIVAKYTLDSSWADSTSNTVTTSVSTQAAGFTVTINGGAVTNGGSVGAGTPITFTATYNGSTNPAPAGTISFTNSFNSGAICGPATLVNGVASCTVTSKPGGPAGLVPGTAVTPAIAFTDTDGNYTQGATTSLTFSITPAATAITFAFNPSTATVGQSVTITATVTTQLVNINPTATLTITPPANTTTTCSGPLSPTPSGNNAATYSCIFTVGVPGGGVPSTGTAVTASATYAGDTYTAASGPTTSQNLTITQDTTTTTVSLMGDSPAPTYVGHTVTITVTTSTTNGVKPDWTKIAITPPVNNSSTSYPAANTCPSPTHNAALDTAQSVTVTCTFVLTGPLGTGNITASAAYASPNGDPTTGTATSSGTSSPLAIALDVTAITSVTQSSDDFPNPTQIGRTVTIAVTVVNQTAGAVLPNGNPILPTAADVAITPPAGNSSNAGSCSPPTQTAATANSITVKCTYLLTGPLVASVTASASYTGDSNTAASGPVTSAALTVTKAVTTISSFTAASPTNFQFGGTVTLTATVATQNNGTGVELGPTGSFTFTLQPGSFYPASLPSCGGATATVTPTAGQITVTTPYTGVMNQGTATVTCQFILVPVSAANSLSPDTYKVTYNGDGLTQASAQATLAPSITPALAATQLAATASSTTNSGAPIVPGCGVSNASYNFVYGQPFTLTGTLTDPLTGLSTIGPSTYPPTKNVTFSGNGFTYSAPIVANAAGGTATASVPPPTTLAPPVGCYTMSVNYPTPTADPYYAASSTSLTFSVAQASTMTYITKLTTTLFGQPDILVTVVPVAPGSGSPTGTIEIISGNTAGGPAVANAPLVPTSGSVCLGAAACSTATFVLPGGTYGAVYPGDSNFLGSNTFGGMSAAPTPIVTSSSIALAYAVNNSAQFSAVPPVVQVGGTISIKATVTGTNGNTPPTGSVTFYVNGNLEGVQQLMQDGTATLPSFTPQPGANSVLVSYSGDSTYPPSTISAGFNVSKVPVQVTPNIPATGTVGQPITLSVRLAGPTQGSALPTGTVTFYNNGAQIGTPATISNGVATLTLSNGLSTGQNNISISYSGDANYASLTQNVGTINVGAAQLLTTTTTLTVTVSGTQMTLTATVAPSGSATGTPTGTVQFVDTITGSVLGTATLSNGTATTTIPLTTDSIVAIYSGDTSFMASTSAPSATISVTNAASYVPAFSPGEIATVFGSNLTTQTITGTLPLTDSLGGVTVTVTDSAGVVLPASIFYVSPSQLSFLIPPTAALGTATVTVTTANGSLTASMNLTASTAALFTANANGKGPLAAQLFDYPAGGAQPTYVDTATLSGTTFVNTPLSLSPTTDSFYLYLYGTGFDHAKSVTVTINGQTFTPAYFGPQGTYAGLDQINVLLPQSLANAGPVNVSITVDGQVSNVGTIQFGSGGTN